MNKWKLDTRKYNDVGTNDIVQRLRVCPNLTRTRLWCAVLALDTSHTPKTLALEELK